MGRLGLTYKFLLGKKCREGEITFISNIYLLNPTHCISWSRHGFTRDFAGKHIDVYSGIL